MKIVELLKISSPALKLLSENEVNRDDWRFVPMYEEFQTMRGLGVKYAEVVRMLAEDYGVGRATVERAVSRLGREIVMDGGQETTGRMSVKRPRMLR